MHARILTSAAPPFAVFEGWAWSAITAYPEDARLRSSVSITRRVIGAGGQTIESVVREAPISRHRVVAVIYAAIPRVPEVEGIVGWVVAEGGDPAHLVVVYASDDAIPVGSLRQLAERIVGRAAEQSAGGLARPESIIYF